MMSIKFTCSRCYILPFIIIITKLLFSHKLYSQQNTYLNMSLIYRVNIPQWYQWLRGSYGLSRSPVRLTHREIHSNQNAHYTMIMCTFTTRRQIKTRLLSFSPPSIRIQQFLAIYVGPTDNSSNHFPYISVTMSRTKYFSHSYLHNSSFLEHWFGR